MDILGISAFYHDSAAAILRDGRLIAAAQEERFSRIKFDERYPARAIEFCLREANIQSEELDYAVFYEKPLPKFERILLSHLQTYPRSSEVFREGMISWFGDKLWLKSLLAQRLNLPPDRILFVEHHLSHAASAMFCSPFGDAGVLTLDGVGEWTTTAIGRATADWGRGKPNSIELSDEIRFPHSLGLLYSAFTAWLGFKVNSGEYKVMGMAAYGRSRYRDKLDRLIRVYDDGSFRLNMDYFSFHRSARDTYTHKFVELFGPPRSPEAPFIDEYYADVAASVQSLIEDVVLQLATAIHRRTGSRNLAMAGGVALNASANGRLIRDGPFEQVYIQPNAGDAGGALGAALYVYHVLLGKPREFVMEHIQYGQEFDESEIRSAVDAKDVSYKSFEDNDALTDRIVDALLAGKIVGLFQGRFEWGPRALGNRSILADPRRPQMKEIVNTKIKFRELFRPFAPAIPEGSAEDFFDLGKGSGQYPPRFMLMVAPAKPKALECIPAVVHEGTGRLQTIRREFNPLYYDIVSRFGEATGVPVCLNTSFNLRAEPIVATPEDALSTFERSEIDMLALGNYVIDR